MVVKRREKSRRGGKKLKGVYAVAAENSSY